MGSTRDAERHSAAASKLITPRAYGAFDRVIRERFVHVTTNTFHAIAGLLSLDERENLFPLAVKPFVPPYWLGQIIRYS